MKAVKHTPIEEFDYQADRLIAMENKRKKLIAEHATATQMEDIERSIQYCHQELAAFCVLHRSALANAIANESRD